MEDLVIVLVLLCGIGSAVAVILAWGEYEAESLRNWKLDVAMENLQLARTHEMHVYEDLGMPDYESSFAHREFLAA